MSLSGTGKSRHNPCSPRQLNAVEQAYQSQQSKLIKKRVQGGITDVSTTFRIDSQPLSKQSRELWDDGQLQPIRSRFQWLLQSPGLGLLTGEAGVGKTVVLRTS